MAHRPLTRLTIARNFFTEFNAERMSDEDNEQRARLSLPPEPSILLICCFCTVRSVVEAVDWSVTDDSLQHKRCTLWIRCSAVADIAAFHRFKTHRTWLHALNQNRGAITALRSDHRRHECAAQNGRMERHLAATCSAVLRSDRMFNHIEQLAGS